MLDQCFVNMTLNQPNYTGLPTSHSVKFILALYTSLLCVNLITLLGFSCAACKGMYGVGKILCLLVRHLHPHPDTPAQRVFMFLFEHLHSPAFLLVILYCRLVALPSTFTPFVSLFYIFTFIQAGYVTMSMFSFVLWFASKQIQLLQSSGCNCANVLYCRWFCVLRAPANQDASLPYASSVRSAPRLEGFPSKSTLRSLT